MYNFPYLKDSLFLKNFNEDLKLKQQFVKLVVLNFNEAPIEEIQGRVTGGSFNVDGSSSMRRTGNITLIADDKDNDLTNISHLLSINKKIEVFIGFKNTTDEYKDYDIIWFPQGIYVIISPTISHDINGINISLVLHDKMALLNGECGGVLPASVVFHQVQDIDAEGNVVIIQPTIYQIIQQLVNHFGGEQLGKIIISEVDNKIKSVMKWTGSTPLYLYQSLDSNGQSYNSFTTNYNDAIKNNDPENVTQFNYGEDVGYILTDFVYPGQLIGNAGDTVVSILDTIKDTLGNYEYFYDINGNFRFQQIKNYLNTSYSTFEINEINANNYLVDYTSGKSVYVFDNSNIITSFTNAPQYQLVKNDFVVWGKRTNINGMEIPIRYHLAIDSKPQVGNEYKVFFYTDPDDGLLKAKKPVWFEKIDDFPTYGEVNNYYYAADTDKIYKWANDLKTYQLTKYTLQTIITKDYRTELYMAGVESQPFGLDSNYYYTELQNEWPKLYDIRNQCFYEQVLNQPSDIDFFLDFIDTSSAISEFGISNIGRRTTTISQDYINCIFEPDNPDIVIIQLGQDTTNQQRNECIARKQEFVQVTPQIYSMLANGGVLRSAYQEIRTELYQYTNYNQQVSIVTLPIYYLQPNTRITIKDSASGIYGDFMIQNFSLPLDINGTMNISCTKALERI